MVISNRIIKRIEGLQTVSTISKKLGVGRKTAIQYVSFLRKKGLAETIHGGRAIRSYRISRVPLIKNGNPGYYETLNKNSPIKIWEPYEHRIIGRKISVEEVIAWGASTRENRVHVAVLALFNKVRDWSRLYSWAVYFNSRRKVGALYDVARTFMRVRRMDGRIRKKLLEAKNEERYMLPRLHSKNYQDIEKRWKVFIDLNRADLMRYRGFS